MKDPVYEIVRSFSKTVQVKQYEPEAYFCSAKESFYEMPTTKEKVKKSEELYAFCKSEVLKALSGEPPKEVKKEITFKRTTNTGRAMAQNMRGVDADYSPMDEGNEPRGAERDISREQGGDGNIF